MSQKIKNQVAQILETNNVKLVFEFVPFSKSRNKSEKLPSLNYKVKVLNGDREILKTEYSMGCGHCPANKIKLNKNCLLMDKLLRAECETGLEHRLNFGDHIICTKDKILPHVADVIYSLMLDSEVLDYADFEDWASNFGYDADSRSAEKIYKQCMDISLKLRNGLGAAVLTELREVLQDY